MKAETYNLADGGVETRIVRDDGEVIATLRVTGPHPVLDRSTFSDTESYLAEIGVRRERDDEEYEPGRGTMKVGRERARLHRPAVVEEALRRRQIEAEIEGVGSA